VSSIGIFMGGVDALGLSELALRGCREIAGFEGPIELVSTHNSPNLGSLTASVKSYSATSLSIDLPDLAAFFARHGLQIGACGGASWERCCIGAPTLAVVAAANQQIVADALASHGAIAIVSPGEPPNAQSLGMAVNSLLRAPDARLKLAERARALVDGLGATRVALHMLASTLRLRAATLEDGDLIHRWRNHPHTRGVSHSGEEIPVETHLRWMAQVIDDPRTDLFIGMIGERAVGVIRLDDDEEERSTEVSLFLDPAFYGLGLGGFLLSAGEAACTRQEPGWRLVCTVLSSNLASRRLFVAAGYRFRGDWGERALSTIAAVRETNHENRST
jgi:UDP-2,4-diacetamido-2,4,6-trideoxy-beta-L-altropyranose hydrolase